MKIWIVDAFTKEPFKGNPAAVAVVNDFPKDEICQKIASEMNLSETAFVKPIKDNYFHIRWFTPKVEVKLCGHATLATSHILHEEGFATANKIHFDSLSGDLFVYKNNDKFTLDFPLQRTGPVLDKALFQSILGVEVIAAVQAFDDIIMELSSEELVRSFDANLERIKQIDCRGLILTARADKNYDFVSRFFAPKVGVPEDPVTGSAHCKLADYWSKKLNKIQLLAYQASQRGGELDLAIHADRVYITGNAITVMAGKLQALR